MPYINKIVTLNGTQYDICDSTARAQLAGAIKIKGKTTTALSDNATTNPITINGEEYTAVANDAVFYSKKEFIFDGTKWNEFGDLTGLGALAVKDSVSTSYTPTGTVSQPTFAGSLLTSTGTHTPYGTVSAPEITVTPTLDNTGYMASSETGGGVVSTGTQASCTLPVFGVTVNDETMTLSWSNGSFVTNTPTTVVLPSFTQKSVATGITSAVATAPTFTGTGTLVTVTGTPAGTVSQPTFSGNTVTITST